MQDIKRIKENPALFKELVQQKNIDLDIDELLKVEKEYQSTLKEVEALRQKRNNNVEEIKKTSGKPPQDLIKKGKDIKDKLSTKETALSTLQEKLTKLLLLTPQIISKDTPIGKDESENVEVRKWAPVVGDGKDPEKFDFEIKDHITLGTSLDILDLDRGVKTSGFRGYYLKNEGALMHMALMMYGLMFIRSKGFKVFIPPTLVKEEALTGSGHFPFDTENIYIAESLKRLKKGSDKDQKYLIGTAEPSILNYHRDEVLEETDLPIKYAGFSQCYRSEIGSYGKDTKGIYRIHEFMKIEQVIMCKGTYEESNKQQEQMLGFSEEFMQSLELPYRVLQICTGDMGAGKHRMFDVETWMPSRESYGETHSASNLGDWQSRRLNIKIKDKDDKKYYPHALNNTVVASPRVLIAMWENHQQADGSIKVPKVLQPYMGGIDVIKAK